MRFLCLCVVVLSGLVAVRCFLSTPKLIAASNILRGVLANDEEWKIILTQELDLEVVKFDNTLDDLHLTPISDNGITPNAIIQRLVTHESTTGTQLRYGIKVLGIALFNQFMTTLMVHSHLAIQFATSERGNPSSLRTALLKIQKSLSNFANKTAVFGHSIDIFRQLNDDINVFLEINKKKLISSKGEKFRKIKIRDPTMKILEKIFDTTKENVQTASHRYKNIDDQTILEIMNTLQLKRPLLEENEKISGNELYTMMTEIDDYDQVNVSSIGLELCEERFKVVKDEPEV